MENASKREAMYRASRISFGENYLLVTLLLPVMVAVWIKIPSGWGSTAITYGILLFIAALLVEVELKRIAKGYVITNGEVIKVEGIVRKKKVVIPYHDVSGIEVKKGMVGTILKFGTVIVNCPKNEIRMEDVKDPEVVFKIIQNKIDLTKNKKSDDVQIKVLKNDDK